MPAWVYGHPKSRLDTLSSQSDTEISMLDTDQIVPYVNIWNVLRTPVLQDWKGSTASNLPPLLPTFADFTNNASLNQIQLVSAFMGYRPNEEAPNLVLWSPTFAEYSVNGEHLNATSITTEPTPSFDFSCNVFAGAVKAIADYISESRKVRESWKKFYRTNILSSAVSKNGHLSFLVPSYREVCVKTAARDHVVHLEVITLAEEQKAPGTSAVGQMLNASGESWKRWRNRLSNLFSRFLRKTLPDGFTAGGLGFASVEPPLQY